MQFTNRMQISNIARDALKRIQTAKLEEGNQIKHPVKKPFQIFAEYSDDKFSEKVRIDSQIYSQVMQNLTEEQMTGVKELLGEMLETVKSIYEHINIEPKIYGFKQLNQDSSDQELQLEAKRLLNDHFNKNYYSLTAGQRNERYKDYVVEVTYEYVTEDKLSIEDATEHAYKTILVEKFVKSINFPYLVETKIDELLHSDMYGEFFDKDKLINMMEDFNLQLRKVSRVFAAII